MIKIARKSYYTKESLLQCIMSQLFDSKGNRRSLRQIANSAKTIKLCKWKNDGGDKIGSLARAMKTHNISEITLFEEAKRLFLIPQHMEFSEFSQNKKLNYEKPTEDSTLSKSIPKNKQLKELCYRLGITDEDIDISVLTENEVYEFLYAMGYTQFDIDKINDDIKNIKYMGK